MERVIVVNTFEVLREALVTRGTDIAGRPSTNVLLSMVSSGYRGVGARDYSRKWVFLRKLAYRSMHLYGNGLKKVEDTISDEVDKICSVLIKENGKPIPVKVYFGEFSLYPTQLAHDVRTTLYRRFYDIKTLKRHPNNVVLTSCTGWEVKKNSVEECISDYIAYYFLNDDLNKISLLHSLFWYVLISKTIRKMMQWFS